MGRGPCRAVADEASALRSSPRPCKREEKWLEVGVGEKCGCTKSRGEPPECWRDPQSVGAVLVLRMLGIPMLPYPSHFTDKSL